jgi:cytoskeleton protein RodZ
VTEPLANARAGGIFPPGATAGDLLGAARLASGLSIDAVAQQLKLAPRQVRALEEDDYSHLPGRTFVRGFIRSYARLVRLDPDEVLGALATGSAAPSLEAPTLQSTAQTMGELPTTEHSKAGWTRWAIPLVLAAVVIAAAVYEWARPAGMAHPATPMAVAPDKPAATTTSPDKASTPLANPFAAGAPSAEPSPPPGAAQPLATDPPPATGAAAPAAATTSSTPSSTTPANAGAASSAAVAAPLAGETIALAFKDYSWTEVRDRDGRVILSGMNRGGTSQSVSGAPPLELVIGNASDVRVTYRGTPVDLAPHTRQNVARFKLP